MRFLGADNFACPNDGQALSKIGTNLICPRGHNFDLARQGYFNLLLVQHKSSRDPGDSKEMVRARKKFLESGAFEPLAIEIAKISEGLLKKQQLSSLRVLDAGCGEGYYLRTFQNEMSKWQHTQDAVLIGLDISKWAVQAAAASSRQINWVVASNRHPPILPGSLDLIICAFGFPCFEEFWQILKPGAVLLLVDPAAMHLIEMRRLIYPELREFSKEPDIIQAASGFSCKEIREFEFQAEINGADLIQDLFMMTPHYFRTSKTGKENLAKHEFLSITVDLTFTVLIKQ